MILRYHFVLFAFRSLLVLGIVTALDAASIQAQEGSRFVQVEEGLQDTETGLIWGHNLYDTEGFTAGQTNSRTWEQAMSMEIRLDYELDEVIDDFVTYQEFSNAFYDRQDEDWRVATRDELVEAVNAGLMLHLDLSPVEGVQLFEVGSRGSGCWTSTPGGKKRGGFDSAYTVNLITGESRNITVGSTQHNTIPVRGVAAPSGGKPGKGGGNN